MFFYLIGTSRKIYHLQLVLMGVDEVSFYIIYVKNRN